MKTKKKKFLPPNKTVQNMNARYFSREGKVAEILRGVISAIPPGTKVYVVGGAIRNAVYYNLYKKALPQRDYDILFVGDPTKFIDRLRKNHKFTYGKIRRKHEIVVKKKLIPHPKLITDYLVLDFHLGDEKDVHKNLKQNSAFSINGFAIPLSAYLDKDIKKNLIALPGAVADLKNRQLRLNRDGYKGHPANLFAALRFMSIGFAPPNFKETMLLLKQLPRLEKWRFESNVKKVFDYAGGEAKARRLVKRLGIKTDVFDFEKLRL